MEPPESLQSLHARIMGLHPSVRRLVQVHAIREMARQDLADRVEEARQTAFLGHSRAALVDAECGVRYVVYETQKRKAPSYVVLRLGWKQGRRVWKHVTGCGPHGNGDWLSELKRRRLKRARRVFYFSQGRTCGPDAMPRFSSIVEFFFKCKE